MPNEIKKYVQKLIAKGVREDGRKMDEYRDIKIEYNVSAKSAEGSARVTIGDTVVVAGIKLDMGTPFPDRPGEGTIMVNAELLPLSSPDFESGPPSIESIELSRVVDRGIRESKAIDFTKLCVKKGEKVWLVFIDIYPINDAGNLFDAAALAAMAALTTARFPKYDEKTELVDYYTRTDKPLELEKKPISITVLKIGDKILVDPTDREWKAYDARITVASLENGNISAMQKGGETPLSPEEIDKMIELGIAKAKELRKVLDKK
ncbi:MAG: exosome complex protein Rrp42 [Nanoarchaeota archaeon]|nr:exosome complex protein Rrp42 [Nanoarchaeota archaeon]MCG2717219.1 exosome complex protein Rrp42 [Nanoarchaeota archaeon]